MEAPTVGCHSQGHQHLIEFRKSGTSDHVPVRGSLAFRRLRDNANLPIPRWVTKHPLFATELDSLQQSAGLDALDPYSRLATHKEIIKLVAKTTLQKCLNKIIETTDEKIQVLIQASRALHCGQVHMIPKIHRSFPELQQFFRLDAYGHIGLTDPDGFRTFFAALMREHVEEQAYQVDYQDKNLNRKSSQGKMLRRWLKAWSPIDARLTLSSVQKPDGNIAETPQEKVAALQKHWKPGFA